MEATYVVNMQYGEDVSTREVSTNQSQAAVPATYSQEVALTVTIAILGVWSTVGNLVTILAIMRRRRMRTKTNVFIVSMAVSDIISGAIASPLWLYRRTWGFVDWKLGQAVCKLYWAADEATSYCTAMHVASFAIWRFIMIKWAYNGGVTRIRFRTVLIWISAMWILGVIFGGFIYSSFFASIKKNDTAHEIYSYWPMCSVDFTNGGVAKFKAYYTFSSTTFLITPMAILFLVSILIAKEFVLDKTFKSELRKRKEKRAVAQLALIATSFVVGYLPMTTYITWSLRAEGKTRELDYWFSVGVYLSLRISECMNPLVYNLASSKMREASKEVLCCRWNSLSTRRASQIRSITSLRSPGRTRITHVNLDEALHFGDR